MMMIMLFVIRLQDLNAEELMVCHQLCGPVKELKLKFE